MHRNRSRTMAFLAVMAVAGAPAAAQDRAAVERPPLLQSLYDCRAIADTAERLACFDRQTAALEAAENAREVRIIGREQVRQAQRGLFGLSLPSLGGLFGGGRSEEEDARDPDIVQEIEAVVRSVGRDASGKLVLELENGQRWVQTDTVAGRSPRAGQNVRIRRASLGGFMANFENRPGFRVRRER